MFSFSVFKIETRSALRIHTFSNRSNLHLLAISNTIYGCFSFLKNQRSCPSEKSAICFFAHNGNEREEFNEEGEIFSLLNFISQEIFLIGSQKSEVLFTDNSLSVLPLAFTF